MDGKDAPSALQHIVDADDQPVFALDRALRYTAFNRAHAEVMKALYGVDIAGGESILDYQSVEEDRRAAQQNLERALNGELVVDSAFSGEEMLERRHFEVVHAPIKEGENVVGVVVRASDITELEQAERRMRESEEKFRYIFDFSPLGKSITLPSGEIQVNQAFCQMLGYTREELEHTRWQDITPPEDHELTQRQLDPILAGERDHSRFVKRYRHKDGSIVWADVATSLRRDDDGEPLYFVTAVLDITEQMLARESLQASERRYRELIDHMTSGVVVYEPTPGEEHFIIREFNAASQRVEKLTREEVIGKPVTEAFPGVEEFGLLDVLRRVARTGEPEVYPTELYHDERLSSWRENSVYRLPSGEVVAIYDDVTERVRAEQRLAQAKDLLDDAEEIGHTGGWEYDVGNDSVTWTAEVYRIYGVGPDFDPNDLGQDIDFYAPQDAAIVAEALRSAVATGTPYDLELELDRADGERIWVRTIGRPIVEDGAVVRVVGNITDVTERKQAEKALRDSEHRLRRFYEAGLVGVIYWNIDGEIIDANDRFLDMVGYTRAELEDGDVDWMRMTPPEFAHLDRRSVEELKATGRNAFPFEKEYLRKDGTRLPIMVSGAMLDEERFDGVALVLDISEQKKAEAALQRLNADLERRVADRTAELEATNQELETFAYSVSHDLRAPLRHISGYAGILAADAGDALDDDGRHCLDTISASVREMGVLIDDLLQFSRVGRTEMQIRDVDMEQILEEALAPIRTEAVDRAIEWIIGPLPHVVGDPVLLRQVWANLLDNAVKYSRGRDTARIEVGASSDVPAPPGGARREDVFFVRDNGAGFDMQYAGKLFGVFQRLHSSTQFEGTGIGLANVERIISRLGGRVWAEAALDEGATFHFALPRHEETR